VAQVRVLFLDANLGLRAPSLTSDGVVLYIPLPAQRSAALPPIRSLRTWSLSLAITGGVILSRR
jgi:hypothetical protein